MRVVVMKTGLCHGRKRKRRKSFSAVVVHSFVYSCGNDDSDSDK